MDLRDYVELGAKKAGSLTLLGAHLGLSQPQMSDIRAHKRPLNDRALVMLAEYIAVPERELIRANNIAMGKNLDFWNQYGKAASVALAIGLVTNFVTPTPAQAASNITQAAKRICIMLSRKVRKHSEQFQLNRRVSMLMKRLNEARMTRLSGCIFEI